MLEEIWSKKQQDRSSCWLLIFALEIMSYSYKYRREALLLSTPWVRFSCFYALLPTFLLFSFLIHLCLSSSCSFVCAAVIFYSQHVVRIFSSCAICILPHLGIRLFLRVCLFFFVVPISWVAFLLCSRTRYVSSWFSVSYTHLTLPTIYSV